MDRKLHVSGYLAPAASSRTERLVHRGLFKEAGGVNARAAAHTPVELSFDAFDAMITAASSNSKPVVAASA